jgi:flavin reductase (DIM6/NTAB) family NADH-FMN oxidoreductase RutF
MQVSSGCCLCACIYNCGTNWLAIIYSVVIVTLSWLTPANNYGGFAFVIHKTRFSADGIVNGSGKFTLSVAHAGLKDVLLACGKVTGRTTDKFENETVDGLRAQSTAKLCASNDRRKTFTASNVFSALGGDSSDSDSDSNDDNDDHASDKVNQKFNLEDSRSTMIAEPVQGTVAHLSCRMVQHSDAADAGHWLVTAQIEDAFVHSSYWDGKCFEPKLPDLPPLLSFLGSQRFGFITAEE